MADINPIIPSTEDLWGPFLEEEMAIYSGKNATIRIDKEAYLPAIEGKPAEMIGIDDPEQPYPITKAEPLVIEEEGAEQSTALSTTVLKADKWDLAQGKRLAQEMIPQTQQDAEPDQHELITNRMQWPSHAPGTRAVHHEFHGNRVGQQKMTVTYNDGTRAYFEHGTKMGYLPSVPTIKGPPVVSDEAMTDFFISAYNPQPEFEEETEDPRRRQFIETMFETPDYQVLHNDTAFNVMASDMAAVTFAREFAKLPEEKEDELQDHIQTIKAVGKAVKEAQKEVDSFQDMCRGMGIGGEGFSKMPTQEVLDLFHRVKNNPQLKRICELAGRYRLSAQAKQRTRFVHGQDEVVGIELGGDIERLIPSELAMLADDVFELDAMRRIVERGAMQREFRGHEYLSKGPIIVCVDESGSMQGEPIANAKALALAMYWIAKKQNRPVLLCSFSNANEGYICQSQKHKIDPTELAEWLEHFFGNGTSMNVPFAGIPEKYKTKLKGSADMILITDAECKVPASLAKSFNQWKKEKEVRCIGIVVGAGDVEEVGKCCDEIHRVAAITVDCEAVNQCLSI